MTKEIEEENRVHNQDDGFDLLCNIEQMNDFHGDQDLKEACWPVLHKKPKK